MKFKNYFLTFSLAFAANSLLFAADCNFEIDKNKTVQRCFGASGNQCQGGDLNHPIKLDKKTCTATAYVTIGSILHDNCCIRHRDGYMCQENRQVTDIASGAFGEADRKICGQEWNKAWYDSFGNRGWTVVFGPYFKGGAPDDLSDAPARDAMVYDSHGLFKRMWKNRAWNDNDRWKDVRETKSSVKLRAPAGTKLEFKEDAQFCASGRWANGACR